MTSKEWNICTGCFTLREMMILLRHIILSWSYLHRYRYFSKWVWNSTKYVYGKSHFRSTRKAQLCLNPLIAVLSSLDASVKQPFEIHINRQSLVCCAVVYQNICYFLTLFLNKTHVQCMLYYFFFICSRDGGRNNLSLNWIWSHRGIYIENKLLFVMFFMFLSYKLFCGSWQSNT